MPFNYFPGQRSDIARKDSNRLYFTQNLNASDKWLTIKNTAHN